MSEVPCDALLYEWMSSYYDRNTYTDKARAAERKRRVDLGQFVMQRDAPGGSKQFRVFTDFGKAYKYIIDCSAAEKTFYETIFDAHPRQKPYFDLDIIPEEGDPMMHSDLLSLLLTEIKRVIGPELDLVEDVSVYSSHASDGSKYSYHVVLHGYHVRGNIEALNFAKAIRDGLLAIVTSGEIGYVTKALDLSVYKILQQFRILGCSKLGRNRFKTIVFEYSAAGRLRQRPAVEDIESEFRRSLLTCIPDNSKYLEPRVYSRNPLTEEESLIHAMFARARLVKIMCNYKPEELWMKESGEIVNHVIGKGHLPAELSGNCQSHRPSTSDLGALITLRAPTARGYWCIICERRHEHENPYITLHDDPHSVVGTILCPKVVEIRYHCRRDPTTTIRLCSMRGGGKSGMASFTCLEDPLDARQGERNVRSEIEASSAIDVN